MAVLTTQYLCDFGGYLVSLNPDFLKWKIKTGQNNHLIKDFSFQKRHVRVLLWHIAVPGIKPRAYGVEF